MDIDPKGVAAGRVGACKWGVGAPARRVGAELPPAPTEFNSWGHVTS